MVAPDMVLAGLAPLEFSRVNSSRIPSHNTQLSQSTRFGILEGNPHNKVHNNIGGVGHVSNPADFGYKADNLSPTNPVFFLHHSTTDRLWEVWTRKQQKLCLATLPVGADLLKFESERFQFYIDSQGKPVSRDRAGDYVNIGAFDYDYEPGFGERAIGKPNVAVAAASSGRLVGETTDGVGSAAVPDALLRQHAAGELDQPLVVQVSVPRPMSGAATREFDVLINAPPGTTAVTPDGPYYAGTISFFGFMRGMSGEATFIVPLPRNLPASNGPLHVQVVPHSDLTTLEATAPPKTQSVLKLVAVISW